MSCTYILDSSADTYHKPHMPTPACTLSAQWRGYDPRHGDDLQPSGQSMSFFSGVFRREAQGAAYAVAAGLGRRPMLR